MAVNITLRRNNQIASIIEVKKTKTKMTARNRTLSLLT